MLEKPQRHRDTEEAQSHPPILSNAKAQRRKDAKSIHLPDFQRRGAETHRRRGNLAGFLHVARFRPPNGWEPLGRETVSKASSRAGFAAQRPALEKRRPRHLSFLFSSDGVHASPTPYVGEERQNRRAPGTSAGEQSDIEESSLSEVAGFSPVTGDFQSSIVLPSISGTDFQAQRSPLRVFVSSCLRRRRTVTQNSKFKIQNSALSVGGREKIPNSKFKIQNSKFL